MNVCKKGQDKYALFWKGQRCTELGTFKTQKEAVTTRHLETQQMELAEYTPSQLTRYFKVKKICSPPRKTKKGERI